MARGRSRSNDLNNEGNGATLGFEAKLWQAADALRNNMDAAEYKHVVLGLIFLKYISDAFEAKHAELVAQRDEGADPEDPDEYRAENIFWVPPEARWTYLKGAAPQPTIGQIVDDAMAAIERDNPSLKSVLPKDYARPGLDKQRLGQLINLVSDIGLGSPADRARDILGQVYIYFLSQFASAEGKKGGQFYTPTHVVRVLVEMLAPYKGRVYDPCCGSGGMFVQSEKFIEAHSGRIGDISIYGQESNYTTWRLAKMNLAIRGIDAQIAHGDSFHNDQHPDLKADYVLANPPFNDSDWRGELLRTDKRWVYGAPPAGNANFAWVQHFIHHLAPTGTAGFVLANGSMSSNQSGEGEIRKAIVEADLVDCMVALPGQLFYATQIPVCLWFLARDKKNGRFRDRHGETLFIDARKLGTMVDRVHHELTDADMAKIADTYHAWRGEGDAGGYADVPGFCKLALLDELRKHGHVLTPGRYVGAGAAEEDDESFDEKMRRLVATLRHQQVEAAELDAAIIANLRGLGMPEWQVAPLGELIEPSRGISYGIVQPGMPVLRGVPIVRVSDVRDGRIAVDAPLRVAEGIEASYTRTRLRGGELLLTLVGTVGETAVVPPSLAGWNTARAVAVIPVRNEIGAYWVQIALRSPAVQELISSRLNTTVQATLNLRDVAELPIFLPPPQERQTIARIIGALDDKIELNRQMNETLEAMARALFKSWFVNFDPVRAKAEGRDPGLPKPIVDLFPARFVDSQLGEIPEGWHVRDLDGVAAYLKRGISPAYIEYGGVLVLNQRCVRDRRVDPSKGRRHSAEARSVEGRLLIKGDVLVNSTGVGTLGRVAQALNSDEDTIVDSHVTVVRGDEKAVSWNYLGICLSGREEEIETLGEGSTGQTELSRSRLGALPILVPPRQLIGAFDEISIPVREHCSASGKECSTLAAIRDVLLPKLISGEMRVRAAERFVAEVAA